MFSVILLTSASACHGSGNGWSSRWFEYQRPQATIVEATTPTTDQLNYIRRPQPLPANLPAPTRQVEPVEPGQMAQMNVVHLRFRNSAGQDVPALLCTPRDLPGPYPVVIAVHGLNSYKSQVCAQVAGPLTKRGFAVLAPDLPMHGERPGNPKSLLDLSDRKRAFTRLRQAVMDIRQCIDVAEQRPELDTRSGVVLAGYSLGAILDTVVGPSDHRVKAMVLMVGGTPKFPKIYSLIPQLAAMQPQLAISHFSGRPVLMLNGTVDHVITRSMSERLFAAAQEPKQQRWYDCGHLLTWQAYEDAAQWVWDTWHNQIQPPQFQRAGLELAPATP